MLVHFVEHIVTCAFFTRIFWDISDLGYKRLAMIGTDHNDVYINIITVYFKTTGTRQDKRQEMR